MAAKPKLALIDANALIHRAYHALPPMSTRAGVPTNAVFGFTTMLLKMFSSLKPTHVVAAFDVKGPTFRDKQFAAYKAHRPPADEELIAQFDLVRDVLRAFGIPIVQKKGYEADDIIGTLATKIDGRVQKVIVTGDMDTLQLVNEHTSVFTLKRGVTDTVLYTPAQVTERYGFPPKFIADYKGLRGDPSDNIPGVAGIGDKTARELIAQFGGVEDIFAHLPDLPDRLQKKLKGNKKNALLSKKLATIKRNVPVSFSLDDAVVAGYDSEAVRRVFAELEFRSLLQRLPKGGTGIQPSLFRRGAAQPGAKKLPENYYLAATKAEQERLRRRLCKQPLVAFDTETDYLGPRHYPIVGMSFAFRPARSKSIEAWYVPSTPASVKSWKQFFENPAIRKVGHNLKYDIEVLRQSGIVMRGIAFDSMIASYLLHPGARQHSLDTLAVQELDHHPIPLTDLIGTGRDQKHMSQVPVLDIARYACEDADLSWQLYEMLSKQIKSEGLTRVLEELEIPLIPVLADMELAGVGVDTAVLAELRIKVSKQLQTLQEKIWKATGEQFNINSTQQLRHILFEVLKLPTTEIARTQTGYSTAASELAKLRDQHPIIGLLEEHRELSKLLNTYIAALPELVDKKTGRIYASFNQTVAATGRLSSSNPNLQNIPVRTSIGQEIRRAFVAPRGKKLVKADYSQIELRLAAHMSRDEKMLDAFRAGQDIHRATAAWVYGVAPDKVTPRQRRGAKTLNFGVLYGMGPASFARAADVSREEAQSFIERYRQQYAGLTAFIDKTIEQVEELGFVETLFGRKRYLPEIHSNAPAIRSAAERMAFNFPLQGTAADILKKAMIELHAQLADKFPQAKLVLTVHDELVVEAPAKAVLPVTKLLKKAMEGVITLDVPLIVDVSVGKNWKEMKRVA